MRGRIEPAAKICQETVFVSTVNQHMPQDSQQPLLFCSFLAAIITVLMGFSDFFTNSLSPPPCHTVSDQHVGQNEPTANYQGIAMGLIQGGEG